MKYTITDKCLEELQTTDKKYVHIIIVATKPDIIKQAPLYTELKKRDELVIICHTDQHYDFRYSGGVEQEFGLEIGVHLGIKGNLNERLSQISTSFGELLDDLKGMGLIPIPYIHGDTMTAMSIGVASILKKVACVHVEAGVRTLTPKQSIYEKFYNDFKNDKFIWNEYYKAMQCIYNFERGSLEPFPEQIDTRMCESASGMFACSTGLNKDFLIDEGFSTDNMEVVGNSVADAVNKSLLEIDKSTIFDDFPLLQSKEFIPFVIHRRENMEDENRFSVIIDTIGKLLENGQSVFLISLFAFEQALDNYNLRKTIEAYSKKYPKTFIYTGAITYHRDMMKLLLNSPTVVVDSGSMPEELNILGTPCVTIRFGADRPETLFAGTNILAPPIDPDFIVEIINGTINNENMKSDNLYGENVSSKIVNGVLKRLNNNGLFITEEHRLKVKDWL